MLTANCLGSLIQKSMAHVCHLENFYARNNVPQINMVCYMAFLEANSNHCWSNLKSITDWSLKDVISVHRVIYAYYLSMVNFRQKFQEHRAQNKKRRLKTSNYSNNLAIFS